MSQPAPRPEIAAFSDAMALLGAATALVIGGVLAIASADSVMAELGL